MKLVFTCGGTGGHINPALAIASTVRENIPTAEILFVGSEGGMEAERVPRAGFPISSLPVRGLSRKNPLKLAGTLAALQKSVGLAKRILSDFSPDIVIGTGGFACYPTLRAAASLGIKTAVHESNAVPGLAVRLLAPKMSRVWLNFEEAAAHLSKKADTLTVGNPLPRGFFEKCTPKLPPRGFRFSVLSFGGSLGATAINRAVLDAAELLQGEEIYFHHATGKREYESFCMAMEGRGLSGAPHLFAEPYIEQMPRAMRGADVVICRAGAMSISELAAAGVAAILVPSPNVTGDHQTKNARALESVGAAILLPEEKLTGDVLAKTLTALLSDTARRREMQRAIKRFYRPEANRVIFEDILALVGKKAP